MIEIIKSHKLSYTKKRTTKCNKKTLLLQQEDSSFISQLYQFLILFLGLIRNTSV